MNGWLRAALVVAAKDLRVERKTRHILSAVGLFALLVIVAASFVFPSFGPGREGSAAGMLWMAFLFASLLGVGRSFALEKEEACIEALAAVPAPRESIFLGKLFANLAFTATAQAAILPVSLVLLSVPVSRGAVLLVATTALGTIALVTVGSLFATMAVSTRTREVILPLLVIPVAIPVMIAAAKGTEIALKGGSVFDASSWLLVLAACAATFLLAALLTFPYLLEE